MAEWAGYHGVNDDRRERRGDLSSLRASVDAGRWTRTLPTAADVQSADTRADAYTAAWLGVTVLIDEFGVEAVTEAMRPAPSERGEPGSASSEDVRTDRFLQRLGASQPWLEKRWRSELERRTA